MTAAEEQEEEAGLFGELIDPAEIRAGSGKTNVFTLTDVDLAGRRIDASGILPKFQQWRIEDRAGKHGGGRPGILDDRAVMIALMLLRAEGSPTWVTELANIFTYRLNDAAREYLGIQDVQNTGVDERDLADWYNRVWRRLHRIIDLMDAWVVPNKKRLMSQEQRQGVINLRDMNQARLKRERLDWFTNAMLEMSFQAQPRWLRRRWKGAVSMDQTAVRAPSQRGRRKRAKDGTEEVVYNKATGEVIDKWVLEIDADYYPVDKSASAKSPEAASEGKRAGSKSAFSAGAYDWVYMANLSISVNEKPTGERQHPHLVMAASLSKPNVEIGREVLTAIESILERGHHVSRLTTDRGYGPQLQVDEFHLPLKALGVNLVMDYKQNQLGVQGGHVDGGIQVEGAHYCPSTPQVLLDATILMNEDQDYPTYLARIEERKAYRLHAKEKPDERGYRPMVCPALGPSATVECPLRKLHPKASQKPSKMRPLVQEALLPVPGEEPKICCNSSVSYAPEEGVKYEQALHYGSTEWSEVYKHDRNSIESHNEYMKQGPERMHDSRTRRLRGMAAQQFIVTLLLVSANLRKIARFLREDGRVEPKKQYPRRRDTEKMSTYVRWRKKIEQTLVKPIALQPDESGHPVDAPMKT